MTSGVPITVDADFRSYIPALSEEERAQLEANIVAEGCLDPLIVWNGILVDGHNRFEICTRLGIHYDVVQRFFVDRDAALDWMDAHQLGRRNLSPDARKLLLGRRYNRLKGSAADNLLQNGPKGQNDRSGETTADRLAKEHGVSEATVRRAGKFAEEVDADEGLKAAVAAGIPVAQVRPKPEPECEPLPPSAANDAASPEERKLRRNLAQMTEEGLIETAFELSRELAETKAKLKVTVFERDSLKRQMKDFLSHEKNDVIRSQKAKIEHQNSQVWQAKDNANHFKAKSAVLDRKLKAAEKRIQELEGTPIDLDSAA